MKRLWQEESGLTLVEVVVATLLLAIGILGALTILTTGITVNDINRDRTYALNLAEARMEYWKSANLANNGCPIPIPQDMIKELENNPDSDNAKFSILVTASPTGNDKLVQITVKVSWQDKNKPSREVKLVMIKRV